MLRGKAGFTLIEILLTIVISSVLLFAVVEYFHLETYSLAIRQDVLEMEKRTKQIDLMRQILRESHIHTNGKNVEGTKIEDSGFSFITTYFSGKENELYSLIYDPVKKEILLYDNAQNKTVILNNIDACEFIYLDSLGNPTKNQQAVKGIKLKLKFKNKEIQIYEKMMQET